MRLKNKRRGFTLIETIVVIFIIVTLTGLIAAMISPFSHRQALEISTAKLLADLKLARQFARSQRQDYKYYGVRFYQNIGVDDNKDGTKDRQGWKIVRYEPPAGVTPDQMDPTRGDLDPDRYTVIKGSEATDNPEFLDNTYFAKGVILDESSEFQVSAAGSIFDRKTRFAEAIECIIDAISHLKINSAEAVVALSYLIFTPEGSATLDGISLLEDFEDDIVLYAFGHTKTIHITPLTGHVNIVEG